MKITRRFLSVFLAIVMSCTLFVSEIVPVNAVEGGVTPQTVNNSSGTSVSGYIYTPGQLLEIAGKYNGGSVGKMAYSLTEDGLLRIKPTSTTGDNKAFALFEFLPGSIGSIDTDTGAIGGTSNIASDFNAKDYPYMAISYRNKFTNGKTASPYILIRPAVYDSTNGKYVVVYKPENAFVDGYGYTYSEDIHKSIVKITGLTSAWQSRVSGFSWNNVAADSGVGYLEMKLLNVTFDTENDYMDIEYIGFFQNADDAANYVYEVPSVESVTVTFVDADGEPAAETQTVTAGTDISLPKAYAKANKVFEKWTLDGNDVASDTVTITSDTTFIAVYRAVDGYVYGADDLKNITSATGGMTYKKIAKDGRAYVNAVPANLESANKESSIGDNTYVRFEFENTFNAKDYPIAVIEYENGIETGHSTVENYIQPFWYIDSFTDGKIPRVYNTSTNCGILQSETGLYRNITDLNSTLKVLEGSVSTIAGGMKNENVNPDAKVSVVRMRIKNKVEFTADDYINIRFIGFFKTAEDAQAYVHEEERYTVKLYGTDGSLISEAQYAPGDNVQIPDVEVPDGREFAAWVRSDGVIIKDNTFTALESGDYTLVLKNTVSDKNSYITDRDPSNLKHTYESLQNGALKIAYFGGSVTSGAGASNRARTSWRALTKMWFADNYPDAEVTAVDAAIGGTGSRLGAFRVEDEIIAGNPDLVFVEFSVNDLYRGEDEASTKKYYEYVIRQIRKELPDSDIITIFVTNKSILANGSNQITWHDQIAAAYGITSINVGKYLCDSMVSTDDWSYYVTDSVHPGDLGYDLYSELITYYLDNELAGEHTSAREALPASCVSDEAAALIPERIYAADGRVTYTGMTLKESGELVPADGASTATVSVTYTGTQLGIYLAGGSGCTATYVLDGSEPETFYPRGGSAANPTVGHNPSQFVNEGAQTNAEHTVTFTFSAEADGETLEGISIHYFLKESVRSMYTVEVSASDGGKIVNTDDEEVDSYAVTVAEGTVITLKAKPDAGYLFRNYYDITNGQATALTGAEDYEISADSNGYYTVQYTVNSNVTVDANFIPENASVPIKLLAFTDSNANGKIEVNGSSDEYVSDYINSGETMTLTAVANDGYKFAYWKRVTSADGTSVFVSGAASFEASPLGSETYYQPVFIGESDSTTVYIDDITKEILGADSRPADPARAGWTFVDFTEDSTMSQEGTLTVMKTSYTRASGETNVSVVYADSSTAGTQASFADGFTLSAKGSNTKWVLTVGENDYTVSYKTPYNFYYMFNTPVTVTESALEATDDASTVIIHTLSAFEDGGKANFTAAYELPEGYIQVEHGVMMSLSSADLESLTTVSEIPDGVIVGRSTGETGIYTVSKGLSGTSGTWYGRAYVTYKTSAQGIPVTAYGSVAAVASGN